MTRLAAATTLTDLSEKDWQQQVVQLADTLGWTRYHTLRSKGSQPGYPDWTLVRERLVFLELKTEHGKLSPPQKLWLARLHAANVEAYVARPSDLERLAAILTSRSRYGDFASGLAGERARVAASELHTATRKEISA